jgi:hypothetical protein
MTLNPDLSLIPTAADPSGRRVLSRGAERSRRDAAGALDRFRRTRTIPAAGSGSYPHHPSLKHPDRGVTFHGSAAVRAYSQQGPGGPTDEH